MRIFILDDEIHEPGGFDGRHKLKQILGHHDLTLATSRYEGEKLYIPGSYNLLLLDHDMGGFINDDPNEPNTGYHFCKWLIENEKDRPSVFIHSHNPCGKENMFQLLVSVGFHVEKHFYGRAYEKALHQHFGRNVA